MPDLYWGLDLAKKERKQTSSSNDLQSFGLLLGPVFSILPLLILLNFILQFSVLWLLTSRSSAVHQQVFCLTVLLLISFSLVSHNIVLSPLSSLSFYISHSPQPKMLGTCLSRTLICVLYWFMLNLSFSSRF